MKGIFQNTKSLNIEDRVKIGLEFFHSISRDKEITESEEHMMKICTKFPQAIIYASKEIQSKTKFLELTRECKWVLKQINTEEAMDMYLEFSILGDD